MQISGAFFDGKLQFSIRIQSQILRVYRPLLKHFLWRAHVCFRIHIGFPSSCRTCAKINQMRASVCDVTGVAKAQQNLALFLNTYLFPPAVQKVWCYKAQQRIWPTTIMTRRHHHRKRIHLLVKSTILIHTHYCNCHATFGCAKTLLLVQVIADDNESNQSFRKIDHRTSKNCKYIQCSR